MSHIKFFPSWRGNFKRPSIAIMTSSQTKTLIFSVRMPDVRCRIYCSYCCLVDNSDRNLRSSLHSLVLVLRRVLSSCCLLVLCCVCPSPSLSTSPSIRVQSKQRLLGSMASNQRQSARQKRTRRGKKTHVQPLWSPHEDLDAACSSP